MTEQQHRYLTTDQVSKLICYDVRTIRETLTDEGGLLRGRHFAQRPGGRKLLFNWTAIAADMGLPHDLHQPGDLLPSEQMAKTINYDDRTLRETLVAGGLLKLGIHYFKVPVADARKLLFLRSAVVEAIGMQTPDVSFKPVVVPPTATPQIPSDPHSTSFTPSATDFWSQAAEAYLSELPTYTRTTTVTAIKLCVDRDLRPYFGNRTCTEITLPDVAFAIEAIGSQYGRGHAVSCFRALQRIFDQANKLWGVYSPITHLLDPPHAEKLPRVLRIHEAIRLISMSPRNYRVYFIVRLFTGISNDEAHSLRGRSILLDTGEMRVDEIRVGSSWIPLDEKKTRTIKLSRVVKEALIQHRAASNLDNNPDDLVFTDSKGRPLDKARVNEKVFAPLLHAAGILPMQLRELSNTAPFLWLCANYPASDVAEWSGYGSDVDGLLRRFQRLTFMEDGYSNLDRLLAAATSDEARQHLSMPLALPTFE